MRPSLAPCALIGAAIVIVGACGGTEPSNAPPVATFTATCDQLACVFENASTDKDGTIAASAWDFGDGGSSTDLSPRYIYAAPGGEFTVTLAVTDDAGTAATASQQVTVSPPDDSLPPGSNHAPVASFSVSCIGRTCGFADESTDPDASDSLLTQAWDFGDGSASNDANPIHSYAAPGGQFNVTLTVTDKRGGSASATQTVDATEGTTPDRTGTYERVTPHSGSGRHSRYVIRPDGTFEYVEEFGGGQQIFGGRWKYATSWGGWPLESGIAIILHFNGFDDGGFCGDEAYGSFLLEGYLGVAYTCDLIQAGFEEGVYTNALNSEPPNIPPPQDGQIAFVRDGKLYRANTDGTGLVQLSSGPDDGNPAWSPDGSRIAFTRGGAAPGIHIMSADGANPVLRASVPGSVGDAAPTWSPDGEWIAFACYGQDGQGDLCKVRAAEDGGAPVTFFERRGQLSGAAWSPDGSRIAFTSDWNMFDFWFDIWVVSPDGLQPMVLRNHDPETPNPYEQYQPAWSPDGSRIAHVECPWAFNFCSSSAIAVMNADGSGLVRLAAATGFARPSWSPDGQAIAFASGSSIEWVSVDGSKRGWILANGHSPAWRP